MYWYKDFSPVKEFYEQHIGPTPRTSLRKLFVLFVLFIFVIISTYFFIKGINYYDIRENCYITIHYDVLNGDRESIVKALEKIKEDDYSSYYNICQNVKDIYERYCIIPDKNNVFKVIMSQSDGCYIKGSNAILISPPSEQDYDLINTREKQILKYSGIMQKYLEMGDKYIDQVRAPQRP